MKKLSTLLLLSSLTLSACGKDARLSLLVPSGAPFLSVAGVLDDLNYEVTIGPDLLPVALSKGEKSLIIAPLNVGAKLYNSKISDYQLAAMLGWGNLHLLSRYQVTNIDDLEGKEILSFAEHSTPGIMLDLATKDLDVSITYYKSVSDVGGSFLSKQVDYVLLSEPILSKIIASSDETCYTFSLQNVPHLPTIAQFGLFSHPQIDKETLNEFLDDLEANIVSLNRDPASYAQANLNKDIQLSELGLEVITNAIPNSDLEFVRSQEAKDRVNQFLDYLVEVDVNLIGAHSVDEKFYI